MEKWISVKDKLPDKDGYYLVTIEGGIVDVIGYDSCLSKIDKLIFPEKGGFKRPGWYEDTYSWVYEITDVIAWRELPTAYKTEEEKDYEENTNII